MFKLRGTNKRFVSTAVMAFMEDAESVEFFEDHGLIAVRKNNKYYVFEIMYSLRG